MDFPGISKKTTTAYLNSIKNFCSSKGKLKFKNMMGGGCLLLWIKLLSGDENDEASPPRSFFQPIFLYNLAR